MRLRTNKEKITKQGKERINKEGKVARKCWHYTTFILPQHTLAHDDGFQTVNVWFYFVFVFFYRKRVMAR